MKIQPFTEPDLGSLSELQPEGWSSIQPKFGYYVSAACCHPVKAVIDSRIVGVGCAIGFGRTGWLAHIIVLPSERNRGIGTAIVENVVAFLRQSGCVTLMLVASDLGYPIYKKYGFVEQVSYSVFAGTPLPGLTDLPQGVTESKMSDRQRILALDRAASGEDRSQMLGEKLAGSYVFRSNNSVTGFYLPDMGDGLIVAESSEAGIPLMRLRLTGNDRCVLPVESRDGINFLERNGFREARKLARMVMGQPLRWIPSMIYNRIGGNVG